MTTESNSPRARHASPAAIAAVVALTLCACRGDEGPSPGDEYRTTINELLLQDARTCDSGFEYPSVLVEGIGVQLVEELRCIDDDWLTFYEPCREPGCVWADGPQPHAMRPEVFDALQEAATEVDDFISITAAYRDVAMQYYSRWYNENCDASFDAAIPGQSNHQGGRAIDVRFYDFWWDALLRNGFEHPIVTDNPHFELVGSAAYRAESEELKRLSIQAFQRLWNRNNPDDRIDEDGIYGAGTKERLGNSPVEGFAIGACAPGSGGVHPADPEPDAGDVGPETDASAGTDAATDTAEDTARDASRDTALDASVDAGQADAGDSGGDSDGRDSGPADGGIDNGDGDTNQPDSIERDAGPRDAVTAVDDDTERGAPPLPTLSLKSDTDVETRGCASAHNAARPSAFLGFFALLCLARRPRS